MDMQVGRIEIEKRTPEAASVSLAAMLNELRAEVAGLEARNRALKTIIAQQRDLIRRLERTPVPTHIGDVPEAEIYALADCIGDLEADMHLLSLLSRLSPRVAQAKADFLRGLGR